jgi:F-box interacting protein
MSESRRKSRQLSSEHVPDDVVFEILTRLPVKSLIRFRCVSKSCFSIITNPDFIKTHIDQAKSLSNNNGYLLYMQRIGDNFYSLREELCTVVCNSDKTFSHVSRFQIPFSHFKIVGFCNGIFCFYDYVKHVIYLWNPSIRKLKAFWYPLATHLTSRFYTRSVVLGLAYHSQNNDYKILRIVCYKQRFVLKPLPLFEAEVYTLSTDSWRKVWIEPNIGSIAWPCLFFNGALHSIAYFQDRNFILSFVGKFILSFDVNDEIFRSIMLPQNYLDDIRVRLERLAVFNGSLAFFVFGKNPDGDREICYIWVMREYGVVESWTKIIVPVELVMSFFGCNDSGELLIDTYDRGLLSYDAESLDENKLGIQSPDWLSYTADPMQSLVLLD